VEYNNGLENEVGHFEVQPENEEIVNEGITMEDIAAIEEQVPDHNTKRNNGNPQQMFEDANEVEHDINNDINNAMDNKYGEQTSEYNLRPCKPRDYSHLHAILEHTALTQYGLKQGLREFGKEGTEAVRKELLQLHERDVFTPIKADELTKNERHNVLPSLMFLKRKQTGVIKGRGCADGRKQRIYYSKDDASSPSVAIESVILTCVIDA
jgi:hypothetical protein